MKKDIHPKYFKEVEVVCICGNKFTVNAAAQGPIKIESCPACHSTYTGKEKTIVAKGRMEKYLERQKKIDALKNK